MSKSASVLVKELSAHLKAGKVEEGKASLHQFKLAMLALPKDEASTKLIMEALEIGVLLSVADSDLETFARTVAQLKPYYHNNKASRAVTTPRKCHVLGLQLMYLLVEHQLSAFHAELELLTSEEASNPLVSFPIHLERQLMVGLYSEIWSTPIPDPSFQLFVVTYLQQTVRDSIADCVEVAYPSMNLKDATQWLQLETIQQVKDYMQECRDDWMIVKDDKGGERLQFQAPPSGSQASDIPSMKLITQSLSYATEMERIV